MTRAVNAVQVDVWSDIACPFCYIGKRHLVPIPDVTPAPAGGPTMATVHLQRQAGNQ